MTMEHEPRTPEQRARLADVFGITPTGDLRCPLTDPDADREWLAGVLLVLQKSERATNIEFVPPLATWQVWIVNPIEPYQWVRAAHPTLTAALILAAAKCMDDVREALG